MFCFDSSPRYPESVYQVGVTAFVDSITRVRGWPVCFPCSVEWCWSQAQTQHWRDAVTAWQARHHSLCSPQTRLDLGWDPEPWLAFLLVLQKTSIFLSLLLLPPAYHRYHHKFLLCCPAGRQPWRETLQAEEWDPSVLGAHANITPVRKYCFDSCCFYCCYNVIISKCPGRREKGCKVRKREESLTDEEL